MIQLKKRLQYLVFTVSSGISYSQNILPLPVCNCCPTVYTCGGSTTQVVEVINPVTGKTWMDRNLGAIQVATSSTDAAAYGDLFQWGRACDGHQKRTSLSTTTLATTTASVISDPWYGQFIINDPQLSIYDIWFTVVPQSNLWDGLNSINNPCPPCYRLPTELELVDEMTSWSSLNALGAYASPLKFTKAGFRESSGAGGFQWVDIGAIYWTSTLSFGLYTAKSALFFDTWGNGPSNNATQLSYGASVRCIKN